MTYKGSWSDMVLQTAVSKEELTIGGPSQRQRQREREREREIKEAYSSSACWFVFRRHTLGKERGAGHIDLPVDPTQCANTHKAQPGEHSHPEVFTPNKTTILHTTHPEV